MNAQENNLPTKEYEKWLEKINLSAKELFDIFMANSKEIDGSRLATDSGLRAMSDSFGKVQSEDRAWVYVELLSLFYKAEVSYNTWQFGGVGEVDGHENSVA